MNNYVIYSRAFYNTYKTTTKEAFEAQFLSQAEALCMIAGRSMNTAEAKEFFIETNRLLEEHTVRNGEMFAMLDRAVALQMGKKCGANGLGFFEVYRKLMEEDYMASLMEYVDKCREVFGEEWREEHAMKEQAAAYFIYSRWNTKKVTNTYLKKYSLTQTSLHKSKALLKYTLQAAAETLTDLYVTLMGVFCNGDGTRLRDVHLRVVEKLRMCRKDLVECVCGSRLYRWSSTVPLEFARTNLLRLRGVCGIFIKRFKEGMVIVYNRGTQTITVIIETLKNPGKLIGKLKDAGSSLKGMVAGCVLTLDFDADGWVSAGDFCNSMKKLYAALVEMNYLGKSRKKYLKAIDAMKITKSEVIENSESTVF
eukprot:TRINITY_DN9236_c0_g4_i1.p1 TRINITY_DN9236_c0_g4~~TRINITY_DN9236_c0_g4_i1.p1  ORF type:complete len:366 (+),score=93.67 TRINITY_DN9236_c0_g4_i1:547-1644(+)